MRRAMEALGPLFEKTVRGADYTSTLGVMDRSMRALNDRHDAIEKHPALQMTPQARSAPPRRSVEDQCRARLWFWPKVTGSGDCRSTDAVQLLIVGRLDESGGEKHNCQGSQRGRHQRLSA